MKELFYARASKIENGKKYLEVPLIVAPDSDPGEGKHVSMVTIGRRKMPCFYDWIPENYYLEHKRDLEQQAKAEEREGRCRIPDPENVSGTIRCPEENICSRCPYALKWNFDNRHNTSLDAMMEVGFDAESGAELDNGFEPSATTGTPEEVFLEQETQRELDEMLDSLIALFNRTEPKVGAILSRLRQGTTNASEIARQCGLNPKHAAEAVRRAQKKVKLEYDKMKK